MDLRELLRAIRKHWLIVVLCVAIGLGLFGAMLANAKPKYQSSVSFYVSSPSSSDSGALAEDQFVVRRVNSYVKLATSDSLANLINKQMGTNASLPHLQNSITASAPLNTVFLNVTVTSKTSGESLAISQAVAAEFPTLVSTIDKSTSAISLSVVSGPRLHANPVRPSKVTNLLLGFLLGLVVGVGIAFVREVLDNSVRTPEALRDLTEVPVLGNIWFSKDVVKAPLIIGSQSLTPRAESFRQLRTNLQFADVDQPVRVIVVTSSVANEGKSTTSANLALSFAEAGRTVLLIEADLRRPKAAELLGLDRVVGLTDVLAERVRLDDVLQPWGDGRLTVLPSGSIPPNPSELLGSKQMSNLMTTLRARFDTIIIDTPPLLPVTDAAVAASLADGVVLIVRYGKTTRAHVNAALNSLDSVDARVFGTVLNMRPPSADDRGAYDGYGYREYTPMTVPADPSASGAGGGTPAGVGGAANLAAHSVALLDDGAGKKGRSRVNRSAHRADSTSVPPPLARGRLRWARPT